MIGSVVSAAPPAEPVFFYGSLAGWPTYDRDPQGGQGNPFATALVQLLSRKSSTFTEFKADLIERTSQISRGDQQAEVVGGDHLSGWQFLPKPRNETRVALVVVFSEYAGSGAGDSLPGAKHDLKRVADALSDARFVVTRLADPKGDTLLNALKDFQASTVHADVALIYTTGHGVEADGVAQILVPYARADGTKALPVSELARSARARHANLIFYAACRTRARVEGRRDPSAGNCGAVAMRGQWRSGVLRMFRKRLGVILAMAGTLACGGRQGVSTGRAAAENPILGTWRGTSLCTPVRPACHDEIAVYHIAPSSRPDLVALTANKVVDGREVEMGGTLDFHVDYDARTLTYEMAMRDGTTGVFRFTWSGNKMTGTLVQLPGGEVVRNMALEKQ